MIVFCYALYVSYLSDSIVQITKSWRIIPRAWGYKNIVPNQTFRSFTGSRMELMDRIVWSSGWSSKTWQTRKTASS